MLFEIEGKYTKATFTTEDVEETAYQQIYELMRKPYTEGCKIVMMPDIHPSNGCTVGTTMDYSNQKIKQLEAKLIGTDIGCGMLAIWTDADKDKIDFEKLDTILAEMKPEDKYGLGTIGGGNHFVELDLATDNTVLLVIHTGSRGFGKEIGLKYIEQGILEGDSLNDYLKEIEIAQQYAKKNRQIIANKILKGMSWNKMDELDCQHNYIDTKNHILHKGSISARTGERVIIPLNMRDGVIIATGKGNDQWNQSAPHGAGRALSRAEATELITLDEYVSEMKNVHSATVNSHTIDESPMAYKESKGILEAIQETVEIDCVAKPIYNYKN